MVANEKRKAPRVTKRLEVRYRVSEEKSAITSNVSETGLFIRTNRGLNPGSEIDLKIDLPNAKGIPLKGRVVRTIKTLPGLIGVVKSGMGIKLIFPPSDYIEYVRSLHS